MKLRNPLMYLLASCAAVSAGDAKSPAASSGDWEFTLSAGPAWRQSGTLDFNTGSHSAGAHIPSFVGGNSLDVPPVKNAGEYANRTYADGYVRKDGGTSTDGYTTNWGYVNSNQVSGNNISFHATGYQSVRDNIINSSSSPSADRHERSAAPMLHFEGRHKKDIAGFRPGFSASLLWNPVRARMHWNDFNLTQIRDDFRHDYEDIYNLGGFGALVPSAPYSGSGSAPGFVLENQPDTRNINIVQIDSEKAVLSNHVSSYFTADHTTLSFGPTLERQLTPEWAVSIGSGLSMHWLHWSAEQNEELTLKRKGKSTTCRSWSHTASDDEILMGLYLQVGGDWQPRGYDWSVKGLFRYDVGQALSSDLGPSSIKYDTDGMTMALMFCHPL